MDRTSKKIKLIHIVESFGAGVLTSLAMMCRCLDKSLFDIKIIFSFRPESPLEFTNIFPHQVKFILLDMKREISFQKDLSAFLKIKRILKAEQPDIVHLHSSKAGFLGRAVCRGMEIRRVYYSPHGFSFLRTDVGEIKRKFFYYLEKLATVFGGTIVTCSASEYREGLKLSKRTVLIPNAIDIDEVEKISSQKKDAKIRIGITGRITHSRDPKLFAQVAYGVMKEIPDAEFLWIGDGELRSAIEKIDIKITGWEKREEAISYLQSLDIYLHTSRWEGMPMAILEAMACGLPIVCTNIVGNKDLVIHGVNGYLANTADELITYVLRLINDKALRKEFGDNARNRVKENFGISNLAFNLEKLYLN